MLNKIKSNPLFAILAIIGFMVIAFNIANSANERTLLNAMYNANMPVPEWVEIDAVNENITSGGNMFVTYGLGGKTCTSIIKFNVDGNIEEELTKRCYS